MNNGFQTFKQSKKVQPIKFIYKNFENDQDALCKYHNKGKTVRDLQNEPPPMSQLMVKTLMKKDYFKENPHLIEFAKKCTADNDNQSTQKERPTQAEHEAAAKKNKKDDSNLKWGRPFFGIYDRYGMSNLDQCWCFAGPGNDRGIPLVG